MDSLLGTLILAGFIYWAYNHGKRTGNRKGYTVGLSRGRHCNRDSRR